MESGERHEGSRNLVQSIGLDSEDEDDYSSGSKNESGTSIEARLEKFRDNWRKEINMKVYSVSPEKEFDPRERSSSIKVNPSGETSINSDDVDRKDEASEMERQAMELFQKGSSLESSGKLYDAVAYYRRATQLVPDIESRVYSKEKAKRDERRLRKNNLSNSLTSDDGSGENDREVDDHLEDEDANLIAKFNALNIDEDGRFFICKPASQLTTRSVHFSDLPYDVVLYILRWIVSDELDMRSLEAFGQVCRGFYVISREPKIWKAACGRMWSTNIIDPNVLSDYNDDWRSLYIERPRVNVNGAYISKASYVRQGEASFQDVNYRPCYLVEYYRYLRFFPGGTMMMLNTPDDPYQTLAKLKSRNSNHNSIVRGHYFIQGSQVSGILKAKTTSTERVARGKRGHKNRLITMEKEYRVLLEIRTSRKNNFKCRNNQLVWLNYTVISRKNYLEESISTFDLPSPKFPPFVFSRVKSYGLTATGPLV